jgi:hypothetical protein
MLAKVRLFVHNAKVKREKAQKNLLCCLLFLRCSHARMSVPWKYKSHASTEAIPVESLPISYAVFVDYTEKDYLCIAIHRYD